MRRALLVANPASGRGSGGLARARCLEELLACGVAAEVVESPGPGLIAQAVGEHPRSDFELLLAAGGDGTVREVAEVAARLELPLGILPLGTSNSFARELGLPVAPEAAARIAGRGRVRRVDMGLAGGAGFVLCWGAGIDAEVVRRVHLGRRGGTSKLKYVAAAAGALVGHTLSGIEATVDGVCIPAGAVQLVVCNARLYGGHFVLAPEARLDDGWLDVVLVYGGRGALLGQALRALRRRPLAGRPLQGSGPGAVLLRAREVLVSGPPGVPVEIDGDIAAGLPVRITVQPGRLQVIVPR
jgi:YegS/Rv2252/BmrU family lipid kinase